MSEPWEIYDAELPLLGATYGDGRARMIALGLRGGGLVVVSPGKHADDARRALVPYGSPRYLLAPNRFHNLGLAEWRAAYPECRVVAHPNARVRLERRVPDAAPIGDLHELAAALPAGARLVSPPMAKQGETWLAVDRGPLRALAVCDAITNLTSAPATLWLLGFRARLMTNPFFKRIFLTSRTEYRAWMDAELRAHPPNLFIPAHGGVLRGENVAAELARITAEA